MVTPLWSRPTHSASHCGALITVTVSALQSRPTYSASHCWLQLQAQSSQLPVTVTALRSRTTYSASHCVSRPQAYSSRFTVTVTTLRSWSTYSASHCGPLLQAYSSPVTVTARRSQPTYSASHCWSQLQAQSSPVTVMVTTLRSRPTYSASHCGALVTALVEALRSWCCGHTMYIQSTLQFLLLFTSVTRYCPPATKFHFISNKTRNSLIKQLNGNGKNTISVSHWNLGAKKWKNKRDQIQAFADQKQADIIFISEANLDESTPCYESVIQGYNITYPKTVYKNGTARLIMLAKNGLDFVLKEDLMDDIFTSIWIKISRPGVKSLLICGLYREHQYLNQDSDWSLQPAEQSKRWSNFLSQVETARISATCHIIGDFNLDHKRWDLPDHHHLQMITDAKNTLETGGFFQLITEVTRSWPGQSDTLINHFWTNDVQKVLSVSNLVRAVGDHNVISASI